MSKFVNFTQSAGQRVPVLPASQSRFGSIRSSSCTFIITMPGSDAGSGSILLSAFPPPPNRQSPLKKQYSIHPHPTHSRSRPHAQPRPRQPILISRAQSLPGTPAADDKLHLTTRPFTAGAHAHAQAVTSPSARTSIRAPSVRSMSMSIRPQANHNRGRSRTMRPPPITPAEFERLPPTLQ